jgi:hypothetical protein
MTIHFLQPIRIHSSGSHVHELSKTSFLRDRWSSITTTNQNTSCWITEPPNLSDKLVIFKQDLDHTFITKNWIKPHLTLFITKTPSEGPQVALEEFPWFSLAKVKADLQSWPIRMQPIFHGVAIFCMHVRSSEPHTLVAISMGLDCARNGVLLSPGCSMLICSFICEAASLHQDSSLCLPEDFHYCLWISTYICTDNWYMLLSWWVWVLINLPVQESANLL